MTGIRKFTVLLCITIALSGMALSFTIDDSNSGVLEKLDDRWNNTEAENQYLYRVSVNTEGDNLSRGNLTIDDSNVPFNLDARWNRLGNENYDFFAQDISETITAGNYTGSYSIGNKTEQYTISVRKRHEQSIRLDIESRQLPLNQTGTFGEIQVENKGTTEFNGTVSSTFKYFDLPENVTVSPGDTEDVEVEYNLSDDLRLENRTEELRFSTENGNSTKQVDLEIVDGIYPTVSNYTANDTEATIPTQFRVQVSDNVGIDKVVGEVFRNETVQEEVVVNETTNETEMREETEFVSVDRFPYNLEDEDDGIYTYGFDQTNLTGTYLLKTEVSDERGNTRTVEKRFEVDQLDNIEYNSSVTGTLAQRDHNSRAELFTLKRNSPVNLTLDSFEYTQSLDKDGTQIRVVLPSGGRRALSSAGDSIKVSEAGTYMVWIQGNRVDDYVANFNVDPIPEYHVSVEDVTVSGKFASVSIPSDVQKDWPGAEHLECTVKNLDRDNLETGRYVCNIPFYITDVGSSIESNSIPMSPDMYQEIQSKHESTVQNLRSNLSTTNTQKTAWQAATIIILVFFTVGTTVWPRVMIMPR